MARRQTIGVRSENCTGCQLCKLACSFIKTSSFSLSHSYIQITRLGTAEQYEVSFTPECDRCGFCVNYCGFDAIARSGPSPAPAGRLQSATGGLDLGD